jgi:hypothetical protein
MRRARTCFVVLCAWLSTHLFHGTSLRAHAQTVPEAPRVLSLPALTLPAELPVPPDGLVEVIVVVAVDGTGRVEECSVQEALCALVRDAVAAARFAPARREHEPVAAKIRLALRVTQSSASEVPAGPAPSAPGNVPSPLPAAAPAADVAQLPAAEPGQDSALPAAAKPGPAASVAANKPPPLAAEWGARARVQQQNQPGMRRLELAEVRDMPGAFGDPFRAVDALPGVVPVLSGLPYFYVRGSPPAGTMYIYDDIPLPTLYHLAVGPAVIHPLMVGPIRLYSGVAPARYGRLTGGVVVGEGPPATDGLTHAEAELRFLDVSGYAQTKLLGGTFTGAVRYGYPALLLSIFSPRASLAYWDYQLRYAAPLSRQDRIELVALGSYDSLAIKDSPNDGLAITFHRFEPRFIHHAGRTEFGAALLFGWEESKLGSGFQLRATRVGPRVWLEQRLSPTSKLRLSADMQGIEGDFSSTVTQTFNRQGARGSLFGNVPSRSLWGVQAELGLRPWTALEFQFGARADAWVQGGGAEAVLDPRLRTIFHVSDELDFHVAAGVMHQPAVFFVPLPGIADLANDRGLQTALQSELGVGWDTPIGMRVELQGFMHRYQNLVFTDTVLLGNALTAICDTIECHGASVPSRINGLSYGSELFLRRPITERLSGFVSYTLAWSAVDRVAGLPYTPSWDVRHVGNLVLQWRIGQGWSAGLRWFVRSGKSHGDFLIDDAFRLARDERRLPWFLRLDLELAYQWPTAWGRLRVALEWFNATLVREPVDIECGGMPRVCQTRYIPAIFFPNLSVRGEH